MSAADEIRSSRAAVSVAAKATFRRRTITFSSLASDLESIADASSAGGVRAGFKRLQRHLRLVREAIATRESKLRADLASLAAAEAATDREPAQRETIDSHLRTMSELEDFLYPIVEILEHHEGRTALNRMPTLLLGEWGTGKTHFACDIVLAALAEHIPAVAVLAPTLDGGDPLTELANEIGFSNSESLLRELGDAAVQAGRRALIVIDAVNEADRSAWNTRLPTLLRTVARHENVALLLTCRAPFEQQMFRARDFSRLCVLYHPGFGDQEFDAQLEFFDHYRLPALHVPLLAVEFARPLFLKLLCEGLVRLSRRTQQRHLDGISSGQKGMTYVLENFVGAVGSDIETRHELPRMACWYLLKGHPSSGFAGLAGRLANLRQEWLTPADVETEAVSQLGISVQAAKELVRDMVSSGLLVEQLRYSEGSYHEVFSLPYQRFSDHLVARHLLLSELDVGTVGRVRRSFYKSRRLGAVFQVDRMGSTFAEPGIASALMVEFPERVKRLPAGESRELIAYLPKDRLRRAPISDAFVEGLYWRDAGAFTDHTERVVASLLRGDPHLSSQIFEVLLGLAARHRHPWNGTWLWNKLSEMNMPNRDLKWSEFIRQSEGAANVHRLLAWSERAASKVPSSDADAAENLLRLLAMLTVTTDRAVRDRATRAMVTVGETAPRSLFELVTHALQFNDPYLGERVMAASYGVALRHWGHRDRHPEFDQALTRLADHLFANVLAVNSKNSTWHALTRSYAEDLIRVLLLLRPRALSRAEKSMLARVPAPEESPFRDLTAISEADTTDGEHAIHMDFGNYTMGRLVNGRRNYDMDNTEYVGIRRQIADRVGMLGYRVREFEDIDRVIARYGATRSTGERVDRYGKKYAWIAYFEMYGIRSRQGLVEGFPLQEPRSTDVDIDPTFPREPPVWRPPLFETFAPTFVNQENWLTDGEVPDYKSILALSEVDGHQGPWLLLDAVINEDVGHAREIRAGLTTAFVPRASVPAVMAELQAHPPQYGDIPESGTDHYTFLGEVPWSTRFGSDVRRADGAPRHLADRAFASFANGRWRAGIKVEATTRTWGWESYHSSLNQLGSVTFPSPSFTSFHKLRGADGSADLLDQSSQVVTLFRRHPGPAFGSTYLYVRKALVDAYLTSRRLALVCVIRGERTVQYDHFGESFPANLRAIYATQVNDFVEVHGPRL
ncbi:ATP-binding protein [Herbiconiux daphne]|uniref:ATP-binding protein n=1 Tax=Herbiconiux daphne TaxID=2970914 RepID=A0ABT2GZV6_9MICO|nr:ATP-binding protein [Herbiconiux daphne]MCS5732867.1 ATP-binding protein [Herbiconiux daphne]